MTEELRQQHIKALLVELDGNQRRLAAAERAGDSEQVDKWRKRAKAVEGELRAYGHELQPKHERAERRRGRPPGSKNRSKVTEQAEAETQPVDEAPADADQ